MENNGDFSETIEVLGLQKKPDNLIQGYWLCGRNGKTMDLAFACPGHFFWKIEDDLNRVLARIDYENEERNPHFIKSVKFFGPSDEIKTLIESIGFAVV